MSENSAKTPLRITISQAANLLGVNEKTIRRAIADGKIFYIVVRGVYKINFESLLKWSQSSTKIKNKMEKDCIGQYVEKWKIKNKLYTPNPEIILNKKNKAKKTNPENEEIEKPKQVNENLQNN